MKKPKEKALVVARNLPPLVGGMERLVWHAADALREEYRVHVIGPSGCADHLPKDVTTTEISVRSLPWFLVRVCFTSVWEGLRFSPDLVFAGSGLTAPFAWLASRLAKRRCAVYLHGLDIEARNPVYRTIWPRFLRRCDPVFVNSRFSKGLAQEVGIKKERINVLHPGVSLPDVFTAVEKRQAFRERHGLGDAPVMLYVGRITVRKGLAVFMRDILPLILREQPDARLVVVGDEARQALLQSPGEAGKVRRLLDEQGMSHVVLFLGQRAQDDPELDEAYFATDVNIFPVQQRENDNEGFGMVAVEAAAHGLPTVAFAVGGVPEAVLDGVSGSLVQAGDNQGFARAVLACLRTPNTFAESQTRDFARRFAWDAFGRQLRNALK